MAGKYSFREKVGDYEREITFSALWEMLDFLASEELKKQSRKSAPIPPGKCGASLTGTPVELDFADKSKA